MIITPGSDYGFQYSIGDAYVVLEIMHEGDNQLFQYSIGDTGITHVRAGCVGSLHFNTPLEMLLEGIPCMCHTTSCFQYSVGDVNT